MADTEVRPNDRKLLADAARLCRRLHQDSVWTMVAIGALFPVLSRALPAQMDDDREALAIFLVCLLAGAVAAVLSGIGARRMRRKIRSLLVTYLKRKGPARRTIFARATPEHLVQVSLLETLDSLVEDGRVRHTDRGYELAA